MASVHSATAPVVPQDHVPALHERPLDNNFQPAAVDPHSRVEGRDLTMRDPRKATNLTRSIIFAVAVFCAGTLAGVAITMLAWSGLKDRFNGGLDTHVDGDVAAHGDIVANGDFDAEGVAGIKDIIGKLFGYQFGVPGSEAADAAFGAKGDLDFVGGFEGSGLDAQFDGDAAVDIGNVAPVKLVVSVGAVFGIVVGAFAWLVERQLAASDDRRAILAALQNQPAAGVSP